MLFRLLALWLYLMATSLHFVGARAIAVANTIEERVKTTYAGGKAYSIVTDQLGTPTEAYNAEGEEVWSRRLDMNGNILEENYDRYAPYSEQIRIPFLFQGQYYDHETELTYNRFRYYSPELSRCISEDPIRFSSGEINFHSYISDSNILCDVFGLQGTASYKKPGLNGNAKKSENDQHGYEIYNRFGQVVKTGVSGGRVRKNDQKSARAEKQVRAWNRDANDPNGPYTSKIVKRVKGGRNARKKILKWEIKNANRHRATLDPSKHKRP